MSTVQIKAYHLKQNLDLKRVKEWLGTQPIIENSAELFYKTEANSYVFISNYGAVVLYNYQVAAESSLLQKLLVPLGLYQKSLLVDEFDLMEDQTQSNYVTIAFGHLILHKVDEGALKIIMLNLAQSVALSYYDGMSQEMIAEVKQFTTEMELKGRLNINNKAILKFIGKTLNTQNRIAENLYIFDAPAITWEDEYYNAINSTLARHFELNTRYRAIENNLKIIEANLHAYMEVNNHRESSKLEWIIIILILVEVLDTFLSKIF